MSLSRRTFLNQSVLAASALSATTPLHAFSKVPDTTDKHASASCQPSAQQRPTTERNKTLLRERYRASQHQAVPPTLPGAVDPPAIHKAEGNTVISAQDPPGGIDDFAAVLGAIAGWHAQSTAPSFTSYGPMIAEADVVVEEWETYFHGLDGTMYSNQYCWIKRFANDQVVEVREYLDSHHAYTVLGLHAPWKALEPPTAPRRHWRPARSSANAAPLKEMETVFPVRQQFELAPNMLSTVVPTANASTTYPDTVEGHKALITAMRNAQAAGNSAEVASYYGQGFTHFIAGEGPLGWNPLPTEVLYEPLIKHLAGPITVRLSDMVAENGAVFEEMDILAPLDDGTVYNNWHCFIHEIREGKIVQTREYMDTHHFWVVLSRWAEWGKTPVAPMRQARRSNLPYVTETFQGRNPFLKLERWQQLPAST